MLKPPSSNPADLSTKTNSKTKPRIQLTKSILQKFKMQKRINFSEDLSRPDLDHLARLFSFPNTSNKHPPNADLFPPDNWLNTQANTVSSSPPHLLRSTSLLPKLAMKLPFAAPRAVLCSAHKPLNPFLTRRIFLQLCAEAGLRVQGLVAAAEREDAERDQRKRQSEDQGGSGGGGEHATRDSAREMDPEVRAWLRRLTALNSLWMSPGRYRTQFRAMPDEERCERVQSGCEACILAFVGGNAQVVRDLRTSMVGRARRGHESRLWGLVEAWTRGFERAEWIRDESERVGRLVMKERRRARRRRRRERRERRLKRKNGGMAKTGIERAGPAVGGGDGVDELDDEPEVSLGDEPLREGQGNRGAEEHDFEDSIIDYYHNAAEVDEDTLHPAFRNSFTYDPTSGTFQRRPPNPPPQPSSTSNRAGDRIGAASRFTFYTQSAYSQDIGLDSGFGGSSSAPSRAQEAVPPLPTLPSTTYNPFVKATSSRKVRDKHIAEKRAESYQKLVGFPADNPAPRSPPSDEAMREYMRNLWEAEEQGEGCHNEDDDKLADERVKKALADAYGDRSETDRESRETHLTTWSGMMKKGGQGKWLGL